MNEIREKIRNRKFKITVAIISFFIPIYGIFVSFINRKKNTAAAKVYAFASAAGFIINFILVPMV